MTRARDNPLAWYKLLIALEKDDIKAAREIAGKYGFSKNRRISRYNYYCKLPDGRVSVFGNMEKLADFLDISPRALGSRFNIGNLTWEIGKRKGYRIWRNLKVEEE